MGALKWLRADGSNVSHQSQSLRYNRYTSPQSKSSNFFAEVLAYPEANALELIHRLAIVSSAFSNHLESLPLVVSNPPLEVLGLPGRA